MEGRVVSQIKRKTDSGYDNFNIGPELRYVGALAGSGNNNLEEQLLLGGNRIIKTWEEKISTFNNNLLDKTWVGLTELNGGSVLTDGDNIYYSDYYYPTDKFIHYVFNKSNSTLSVKNLNGLTSSTEFYGAYTLTDGDNFYYSYNLNHYILNKNTSTLSVKNLNGLTNFKGNSVLTDGDNIYYSQGAAQYILDKATSTLLVKNLSGLTQFEGGNVLTDGDNIYYSLSSRQYVLNKTTSKLSVKILNGLTRFNGGNVLTTDGKNFYYSGSSDQYVLDKTTSTLSTKTLNGLSDFYSGNILTDENNFYYSYESVQKVLGKDELSSFSKQVIEYRTENMDNNYYILEINDYGNEGHGGNIYVEDFRNTLYISNFLTANTITQTAVQEEYNPIIYFDNGTLRTIPDILIKEYNLKYQKGNGPIDVSKKEIYQGLETIDEINVKVNKEIVTDLLLS